MINITKLYCGAETSGDPIRYGHPTESQEYQVPPSARERRPVTVWGATRRCNLACVHCYSDSADREYSGELTTREAKAMIDDLSQFAVPVLLMSGGEPLIREDIFELAEYAGAQGLRTVFSTNGTLINKEIARKIREVGVSYVGISLDGMKENNDRFRGRKGACTQAMEGFRNCLEVGQKVGLRFTLTRYNYDDLEAIFDLIETEGIPRACFYHLVYSGRGSKMEKDALTHQQSRRAVEIILARTEDFIQRGLMKDILTVDNHVDGPYLYLKLKEKDPGRAKEVMEFLRWNGGGAYSSGVGIGNIDPQGNVHPDQFWQSYTLGNIRERSFSEIWQDTSDPLMAGLKDRLPLLKGRCAKCCWQDCCGGSFRVRAQIISNDPWAPDPACYLTDEEIGITRS